MGRRKIEMVRKEILMVSLMTGGYPIDGRPKEKTEKMHPEIWKRYALFAIVILLIGAVTYFAFTAQTPVKTSQDASQEVKTPAENPVMNIAVTDWQKKLETDMQNNKVYAQRIQWMTDGFEALAPVNTKEIVLDNTLYFTDLSIDRTNWVISGYIKNKGTVPILAASIVFSPVAENYDKLISTGGIHMLNGVDLSKTGRGDLMQINPGQKSAFETSPMNLNAILPENRQKYLENIKSAPMIAIECNQCPQ